MLNARSRGFDNVGCGNRFWCVGGDAILAGGKRQSQQREAHGV